MSIPKRIFIVPYRDRKQQKFFFSKYMTFLLEGETDYEIYFSHQCDNRPFNRGATRNIGFLAAKAKYPENYADITFVFNDVDTIPFAKIFDYETIPGVVKHYYGYKHTLGGIVIMKGRDFESINGYPNFWGWGSEDTCIQKRCEKNKLAIDRTHFYDIGSPEILQLFDGMSRMISKRDPLKEKNDYGMDGLITIHNLNYTINDKSSNPADNEHHVVNDKIFFINIQNFLAGHKFDEDVYYKYDLREPVNKILHPDEKNMCNPIVPIQNNWTNIPYYPTIEERKRTQTQTQMQTQGRPQPQMQMQTQNLSRPHPFSPNYAKFMGVKPRATTSTQVRFEKGKR